MKKSGETIGTIMEWHETTFPDATEEGQHEKWDEEMFEYLHVKKGDKKHALEELADLFIVACGLRRWDPEEFDGRFGFIVGEAKRKFTADELWEAVCKKMEKNRKRVWKKTGEGRFHHEVEESSPVQLPQPPEPLQVTYENSSEYGDMFVRRPGGSWRHVARRNMHDADVREIIERYILEGGE